jgi:tRNA (guanine-N7-)-methyltransferase
MLNKSFRIRSFVRRDSRKTAAQVDAIESDWPLFGLNLENGLLDGDKIFGRVAPRFLEIGFGNGESLLRLASTHPEKDFIGVETHQPGIGTCLLGVQRNQLTNIRIFKNDVIDVLERSIDNQSLDGIQIFFPDPWPKRRHHGRRLIQESFVMLMVSKLKVNGTLHLATDWIDYAKQMMRILTNENRLINLVGVNQFADRSIYRPLLTKFERRAIAENRFIWELQFIKKNAQTVGFHWGMGAAST